MSEGKTPPRDGARGLDALLAAWPSADRGAMEWDEAADRIVARLEADDADETGKLQAAQAVSHEDLWQAPLPSAPGEVQSSAPVAKGSGASMGTTRGQRDRSSFKDLAKLAAMPPSAPGSSGVVSGSSGRLSDSGEGRASGEQPREREENSGVINLAAIQAEEAAASTRMPAADTGPASMPAASRPAASGAVGSGAMSQATLRSASEPAKEGVAAKAEAPKGAPTDRRRGGAWIVVSSMVAAAAVAAGVFFGLQQTQRVGAPPVAAANPAEPAAAKGGAANAGPAAKAAANAAAPQAVTTPIPTEDRGVDPFSLPQAGAQAQSAGGPGALAHAAPPAKPAATPGAANPAGPGTAEPPPAPATAAPPPAAASAVAAGAPAATGSANLQDLMQQAAGVTSSPTAAAPTATATDALPAPGSVPLKPSMGAIQGALGAAMPGARACLGPDDPVSHATITFKSDGSVQSVAISGGAAGKPAEACIRGALSKARVQPFVQPTFTAPATVRPN
jgi:hypothetical protein